MTTNGATHKFPPVQLDVTLYDLLKPDLKDGEKLEAFCQLKPSSDHSYGEAIPLNDKHIIHSAQSGNSDELAHLQLENCSHLLMFFAGPLDVIFLASEGKTDDESLKRDAVEANAKRSFGVIQKSQMPKIKTYANVEDHLKRHDGHEIRWGFAMDYGEKLPYLFHPEMIYKLNSKRWLGQCDLKSANDRLLDCEIDCPSHKTSNGLWYYGGKRCRECNSGIGKEVERIKDILNRPQPPYVLKLTQSLSSVGTMIPQDESERKPLVDKIGNYLEEYLPRITPENAHLYTTTLVLSDFIKGDTMALNFYIKRDGSPIFLGACHQQSTGESGRQATAITYANQEELQKKYGKILEKVGEVLHKEGYWGPVGADIMEHPENGRQFVIDLNVRMPLSLVLYALRTHFTSRGFEMSIVYECIMATLSRDELEEKFENEFREARIVLLGGTKVGQDGKWAYGMVVAGEDQKAIDALTDQILEYEARSDADQ